MIYNINFSQSYLDLIVNKLLFDNNSSIENLANYIILVPNKRIVKNLHVSFLRNSAGKNLILPRILSLLDLDNIITQDHNFLLNLTHPEYGNIFKPTISITKRAFLLAKLINNMDSSMTFAQSLPMARSLGELIDKSYVDDVDLSNIVDLVEGDLAIHWQETLKFLNIAQNYWPKILLEENLVDIVYRQQLVYKIQREVWQKYGSRYNIIALNVQSYNKAILDLLAVVATMENSDIYFYGLDLAMQENDWQNLSYTHPQKLLADTLKSLQISRKDVTELSIAKSEEEIIHRLFDKQINQRLNKKNVEQFANKLSIISAKNEEEEARTIALIFRETLEVEGKTAALVCSNKNLIVRVISELKKWDVEINDYLGDSLYESLNARMFLLIGSLFNDGFEPNLLLSLLNHPFCHFAMKRSKVLRNKNSLNLYLFRHLHSNYDIADYKKNLRNIELLNPTIKEEMFDFLTHIDTYTAKFKKFLKKPTQKFNFQELLIEHISMAELLCKEINADANILYSEQEGKEMSILLANLLNDCKCIDHITPAEYLDILRQLFMDVSIRKIYDKHPRLYIYGDVQSNLIHHDLMILSALNEGSAPYLVKPNPWMNNYMMMKLGFTPSESHIGIKTNIFAQILGAKEVVLSRSEKKQGKLTNPSRWLLKLQTFLDYYITADIFKNPKNHLYSLQQHMDIPNIFSPLKINTLSFNPPLSARPVKISATSYESLLKNPYLYFVERILKLRPLNIITATPNKKDYGNAVHKTLEIFFSDINNIKKLTLFEQKLKIKGIAEEVFKIFLTSATFKMFKMPIIINGLLKLLNAQQDKLRSLKNSHIEVLGSMNLKVGETTIILSAKCDRIDILENNEINIFDYKTSSNPKIEKYWQQLLILSLIYYKGGFANSIPLQPIKLIDSKYIFIPNKAFEDITYKDNGIENIVDYLETFEKIILTELSKYYIDSMEYVFNEEDSKISEELKHFSRLDEWSNVRTSDE